MTCVAAGEDGLIILGGKEGLRAYRLADGNDAMLTLLWRTATQGAAPFSLAIVGRSVVGSFPEKEHISVFSITDGKEVGGISGKEIPGGMRPTAISASGPWIVTVDEKNSRLIRLRTRMISGAGAGS